MIAASEPLEFIPRGRQAVEEHPGPLATKPQVRAPSEHLLLNRLQNVNISCDDGDNECWTIQEIFKAVDEHNIDSSSSNGESVYASGINAANLSYMNDITVNSEEELYVKGCTAVWTRGIGGPEGILPRTSFTCESTIKHAFFCSPNFIRTDEPDKRRKFKSESPKPKESESARGICLIDSTSLRIYLDTGEDYLTSLEFLVSNVWHTKLGILLEKNASCTTVQSHTISMPRLFSLTHPLDEMCPVLIRSASGTVTYLTESDYKVVFTSVDNDLVLLFDNKSGKHFAAKLRKATADETNVVCSNDTMGSGVNVSYPFGPFNVSQNISLKNAAILKHSTSAAFKISVAGPNITQSPFNLRSSSFSNSPHVLQNSMSSTPNRSQIQSPLARLHSTMGGQSFSIQDMRKVGQAQPSKPIVPEFCLEHLWSEPTVVKEYLETASHGFMHIDLIGQTYLCYLLSRTSKLQLTRLEKSNTSDTQIFGMVTSIPAKDAVCLNRMKMIAVLAPCGTLLLYTGPNVIGKVHVGGVLSTMTANLNLGTPFGSSFPRRSSLLPSSQSDANFDDELHMLSPVHPLQPVITTKSGSCSSLRDPAGNRLTLTYPGGKMYRISIPLMSECPFVSKCLIALRQVLKKDLAVQLIAKWFGIRNAPGSQDLNPHQEWQAFKNVLLDLLGRPKCATDFAATSCSGTAEPKKRRRNNSSEGLDSDWEFMQSFLSQAKHATPMDESYVGQRNDSTAILFPYIPLIFYTMHLLYEDLKLDGMMTAYLPALAEFLYQLAIDLQLECYCLHYFLDHPKVAYLTSNSFITDSETKQLQNQHYFSGEVPSIFKHVHGLLTSVNEGVPVTQDGYPYMSNVNDLSKRVVQVSYLIVSGSIDVTACIKWVFPQAGFGATNRRRPLSVATMVVDVESTAIPNNDVDLLYKQVVYTLIDLGMTRKDIERLPMALHYFFAEALEHMRKTPPIERGAKAYELLLRPELLAHGKPDTNESNTTHRNTQKEHSLSPKIPPIPDVIPKSDVVSGEDGMEHMATKLFLLRFPDDLRINEVQRILSSSKPVNIDIVQSLGVSDHDFIEEQEKQLFFICTRTMALPMGRGMFTLRTCTPASTESLTIPKLCLTGKETLKGATIELQQIEVPPNMSMWPLFHNGVAAGLQITPDSRDIDSTWIVYNKPKGATEGSTEHAGFLMALGLNGHLRTLSFMSIYDYLVKCDEMTSVGLLLGISAAHRGTMDTTTTKLLSVHIEALLPATALELDIPQNIQVASLMGIGMIYQETAKRHIAEILLQEIGRPPGPEMENCVERESYAITAGLALGLVTLGQGESPTGLRDLQLPDTLHYYMIGGNKRPLTGSQKEKYKLPSFQVREGDTVNIDVTAPGATLALGLMFFKTGNKSVAHWMKPPNTNYLLDLVRPDLLLLRILSRGLILWDEVEPTLEWLFGQFPPELTFDLKTGPEDLGADTDHEAICQAYCNIIAGAALCIGLRYAGTENSTAYDTLLDALNLFFNMGTGHYYIGDYAGKSTIESCLILVLLSLSLVCAGSGNIEILKICRMLRARLGSSYSHVTYGSHMAIHMAVGFLYLGAGRFTLSRSPQAIAALVCALFPKFPTHSNDNRYHLQAFRHLYVLAVEPRIFLPRDIDSGKLCLSNLSYIDINNEMKRLPMAPCILPELESIKAVIVNDPHYWPVSFVKGKNWDQLTSVLEKCGCIDIKQKAGCLSHLDDPDFLKSVLAQTLTSEQYSCWKIFPKSLLSFSNDPKVLNFTNKFLANASTLADKMTTNKSKATATSKEETELIQIITLQFYNCLTKDKMHALPIYINLLMALQGIQHNPTAYDVWQFKIIIATLNRRRPNILLSIENLKSLTQRLTTHMEHMSHKHIDSLKQFLFSSNISYLQETSVDNLQRIAALITYYDLPINILNCVDLGGGQLNYVRMLMEFRKLNLNSSTIHCIARILQL